MKQTYPLLAASCLGLGCFLPMNSTQAAGLTYPETKKIEQIDDYHGTEVDDPYRWLEDDVRESSDVEAWVKAQNEVTFNYLKQLDHRESIEARLTELWNYEKIGTPFKRGDWYYFWKNDGLQNQSVLYRQRTLQSDPELVVDPNTWSEDGTVALGSVSFSEDATHMAYSIQDGGSDWRTWRIMHLDTRRILDEELQWIKFSGISWTKDSRGFFYSRFPTPEEGDAFQSLNKNQMVYYHRIGQAQDHDVLVYQRPDQPDWGFNATVTEDGRYLILTVWKGTDDRYRVLYRDLLEPFAFPIDLIDNFDHEYTFVGNDGPVFYFKTNLEAPNGRVIAIDIRRPAERREIIGESANALDQVGIVGNVFVTEYLKDAKTQIKLYSMAGEFVREVTFPGIGTASGFGGKRTDMETFYSFNSINRPASVYRYDILSGESQLIRQPEVKFDPEDFVVKQVFFPSKDGTRIPMFIAHRRDLKPEGALPTLLYGYGGFNISLPPRFSISRLAWMEMGGVFAQANLRGGGEYGKAWHQAGTKLNKQNVFDDFIAAAEWLIKNDYTNSDRLAIQGGSNGGLLVGACLNQRPDLYAAGLPAVGVMDMLRFQQFTAGRFWVDDYGSSDHPEEFKALYAYSPYHNLKPGTAYPATLVTTADTDDRVVPGHSFKYAARLQEYHRGANPVLIRIETRAGHGAGKPTSKVIEEIADLWAFLVESLDFEPLRK